MTHPLQGLFNPNRVAIFGPTDVYGSRAEASWHSLVNQGIQVAAINDSRADFHYQSLTQVPWVPDIVLADDNLQQAVVESSYVGVPLVVLDHSVPSPATNTPLMLQVGEHGLWRPSHGLQFGSSETLQSGRVAVISQSAVVSNRLTRWLKESGYFSSFSLNLSPDSQVAIADLLPLLANDQQTEVIVLHLAHLQQPRRLYDALHLISTRKPVVLLLSHHMMAFNIQPLQQPGIYIANDINEATNAITFSLNNTWPLMQNQPGQNWLDSSVKYHLRQRLQSAYPQSKAATPQLQSWLTAAHVPVLSGRWLQRTEQLDSQLRQIGWPVRWWQVEDDGLATHHLVNSMSTARTLAKKPGHAWVQPARADGIEIELAFKRDEQWGPVLWSHLADMYNLNANWQTVLPLNPTQSNQLARLLCRSVRSKVLVDTHVEVTLAMTLEYLGQLFSELSEIQQLTITLVVNQNTVKVIKAEMEWSYAA